MCTEGHGHSLCIEVENSDDGIPAWVQRWMDDHASESRGDEMRSEDDDNDYDDDSSSISVDGSGNVASIVDGPGVSLILLSDYNSDTDV